MTRLAAKQSRAPCQRSASPPSIHHTTRYARRFFPRHGDPAHLSGKGTAMMQFGPLTLKRCRYGWMLFTGPIIGKCFELYGEYSESELMMMRAFLRPGDTVIDVGANIGDLTLPIAQFVGDAGKVYAIESNPDTFNVLCANFALNQVRNTRAINAFVATDTDRETASSTWGKHAYVGDRWKPEFMTLDDMELDALALLKIDVDGKELTVLQSGAMQIERFRPTLYFENDTRPASRPLLEYLLYDLGYELHWHLAPVFDRQNYFGNPVNHWAPNEILSIMMVGIPAERRIELPGLRRVESADDWWEPST